MTTKRMRIMIAFCWFHSIFWAVCPWAFEWGEYKFDKFSSTCRPRYDADGWVNESYVACMVTICFSLPLIAMLYFYIRIFSIVEKHVKDIEHISCSLASVASIDTIDSSPKPQPKNRLMVEEPQPTPSPQQRKPKELRAHNMILIIILLFLICWATYATVAVVRMVSKTEWGPYWSVNAGLTFAILNSAVNPMVYALRDRRFKRGFKKIFLPIFCKFDKLRSLGNSSSDGAIKSKNIDRHPVVKPL